MGTKDLHEEPFDSGTITKLEIFEDYAEAWIPTFVMQGEKEIHIFDFFSGPGFDSINIEGSPIRILKKIKEQLGNILSKKTKIILHFNEFEPKKKSQLKFQQLKNSCENFMDENPKLSYFISLKYYNQNAEELFFELLPTIRKYPSLVYLDQNGVKFISKEYLDELEKLEKTDFLYFVSSSYFNRFCETEEYKRVLDVDIKELEKEQYRNMHRLVLSKIKSRLPKETKLRLYPFSIKKQANIFGIIFGAKHPRAVDKFLSIAWKRNNLNGEANFDIDDDISKLQVDMFEGKRNSKIEQFQYELEQYLLKHKSITNKKILIYTYENGHIPSHSSDLLKRMKKEKKLSYEGRSPLLTYENVFKKKNIVEYTILKIDNGTI